MTSAADELAARLERIKKLTDEYLAVQDDAADARQMANRISKEVDAARALLRSLRTPQV